MEHHASVIPVRLQRVHDDVDASFGHNPRENKFLMHRGAFYTFGTVPRRFPPIDQKEEYDRMRHTFPTGLLVFRRQADGQWVLHSKTDTPWCSAALVGPDGTFWMEGTRNWDTFDLYHMRIPEDFTSFERVYDRPGTSVYGGVSISPEGNILAMHAASNNHHAGASTTLLSAFYDRQTNAWHRRDAFDTPEGRNGYCRMLVTGRQALGVCQAAIYETGPRWAVYPDMTASWRHVRLFACNDLTTEPWRVRRWLTPPYGHTMIWDMVKGPDGHAYLAYEHLSVEAYETSNRPASMHIARIHPDLSAEVFDIGVEDSVRPCPLFDSRGRWYLAYEDMKTHRQYLLRLDPANGFRPTARYALGDDETPMVLFPLRPEMFGGETTGGDTVQYISSKYRQDAPGHNAFVELWFGEFDLPVDE